MDIIIVRFIHLVLKWCLFVWLTYRPKKITRVSQGPRASTRLAQKSEKKGKPKANWTVEGDTLKNTSAPLKKEPKDKEIASYEYAADRKRQLAKYLPSCDVCGKKFLRYCNIK